MSKVSDILNTLSQHDREQLCKSLSISVRPPKKPKVLQESPDKRKYTPFPMLPVTERPKTYPTLVPELDFANRYFCGYHDCKMLTPPQAYDHLDTTHPHRGAVALWPDYVEVVFHKAGDKRKKLAPKYSSKVQHILELLHE